ncbi:MAG: hypothetical protein SWH61_06530 [Thermodesulfobacteriota bacterium]|nr:hypothetical protein [Thermodesulfobacteriota bacterium]
MRPLPERLWLCFVAVLSAMLLLPAIVAATPPTPPVSIDAGLEEVKGSVGKRGIGYPVDLVQHNKSARSVEVEICLTPYAPRKLNLDKRPYFRRKMDVREGKQRMEIPINVRGAGTYELMMRVMGRIDNDNGFSDNIVRYVIVGKDMTYRIISPKQFVGEQRREREKRFKEALKKHPESPDVRFLYEESMKVPEEVVKTVRPHRIKAPLQVRPVGPSDDIRQYVEDKTAGAWSPEDPLTIRGRLVYLDYDGVWRPLVNVSVNVYDEDVGIDDHLGTTGTDWNGDWSFTVNNDDGWLADGRDIYYTFKLENTRIRVQDCDGIDSTYEWSSAVHDDLDDGTVLDFGSETGGSNANSMQIWNMLNLAWAGAVGMGGRDPGFVDSCFPEGSGAQWDRFWEEIDIPASDNDAPDIVTHEYGHAVMYYAYGSDNPSPGGSHSFGDDSQNASLAWSEGWATGFMLALRPDGRYNWSEGDGGRNIENFSDGGNRDGNRNEGRVAAAINDMIDNQNDDNGGNLDRGRDEADDDNTPNRVSLETMLNDTLWGSWHDDFEEFWASLSGELSGATLGDANEIMYYNYMDVPPPISCVATKVVALNTTAPDEVLEGLRRFRDHALKGFNGGQHLINTYYQNSPELAMILLKDANLRHDVMDMIYHFSKLGYTLTENKSFQEKAASRQPVIDAATAEMIQGLMARIEKKASQPLRDDMQPLNNILTSVKGLDMLSLQKKLADIKIKHPKTHRIQINPSDFNKTSKEAAMSEDVKKTVQKYIPAFDEKQ